MKKGLVFGILLLIGGGGLADPGRPGQADEVRAARAGVQGRHDRPERRFERVRRRTDQASSRNTRFDNGAFNERPVSGAGANAAARITGR